MRHQWSVFADGEVISSPVSGAWMARCFAPWCLAAALLVSLTNGVGRPATDLSRSLRFEEDGFVTGALGPTPPLAALRLAGRSLTAMLMRAPSGIGARATSAESTAALPGIVVFADEPGFLPPGAFTPAAPEPSGFREPRRDGATGGGAHADVAPTGVGGPTSPVALPALAALRPDGSTPSVPRAVALSSTTPAPIEPELVQMPSGFGALVSVLTTPGLQKPNYMGLIDPDDMNKEERCLAEAIYFESRSEPAEGQAAVAQVVLNRLKSGLYPDSVCGVVYQNRNRYKACQFTFACEGKSLRPSEPAPWAQAVRIAREVTNGKTYLEQVGDATHYHADYVRPTWSRRLLKTDTIGHHTFYKLRLGQR